MGCSGKLLLCQRLSFVAISSLFLLISSSTQFRFMASGRLTPKIATSFSQTVNESKGIVRSQIGSRPPRCEKRCSSCGHCEAIQVPTNPQLNHGNGGNHSSIDNARGDDSSNYKPLSWKCKCGNLIFNP